MSKKCDNNDVIYHDGSIIKRNGSTYILKYVKGIGWKTFKVKTIKEQYEEEKGR